MKEKSQKILTAYYQAFNSGSWDYFFSLLAEDIAHDINQGGREVGKVAFREFIARMNRCYREQITDIVVLVSEDGARAAVEFTVIGTYLQTDDGLPQARGQEYCLPAGAFFEISNGLVSRVSNYYNLQDWLRQVGA